MAVIVERYVASIGPGVKVVMKQLNALDALGGLPAPSLGDHIAGGENLSRTQLYVEALDELRNNPPAHIQIARLFQNVNRTTERAKFLYVVMLLSGVSGVEKTTQLKITQPQLRLLREWLFRGCVAIDHKLWQQRGRSVYDEHSIINNALRQEVVK